MIGYIGIELENCMVIFDLDGTLWDSTVPIAESWNILIKRETGRDEGLTPADIMRNQGYTMDQIADDLFGYLPPVRSFCHLRDIYRVYRPGRR